MSVLHELDSNSIMPYTLINKGNIMDIIGYGILLAIGFAIAPAIIVFVLAVISIIVAGITSIFSSK